MSCEDPTKRILSYGQALSLRNECRQGGGKLVLTNGCFDILHRGHLEYLQQSAALGDWLLVAVNSDISTHALKGSGRPVHGEQDRAYALASLRFVDAVFIFPGPRLVDEIRGLAPDFYTKAGDYTPETLDSEEYAALQDVGVEIHILPFVSGHSTTGVIGKLSQPSGPPAKS